MTTNPDIIIIGGGLAGLAGSIHLALKGLSVMVIEKSAYPRHKVCGEYISNEILPYLNWLGADVAQLHPTHISKFEFSTTKGIATSAQLPLGGFGVSRYVLDNFLYQKAIANGAVVVEASVTDVQFKDDIFMVITASQKYSAKIVLGAYGKRSNIDQVLSRDFIQKKSPWLAVKAHYSGDFPNDVVALHNFSGGYCGVSKVEDNRINICYLADYATFKQYKNIEEYQQQVLCKNKKLKAIFESSTLLFDKPLTISQISFDKKAPVENHILMVGDTAGLIHPLCGNGMAMALHSAKIASELVLRYFDGTIANRQELESSYIKEWNHNFSRRLFTGRLLAKALRSKIITNQALKMIVKFPSILPKIIKQTHGKPIALSN